MAQVLNDGTIRHESNCLADLGCTQASVASRLTDEDILLNASRVEELSYDCEIGSCGGFSCGDNSPCIEEVVAVLRDYVRLRKLENVEKMRETGSESCNGGVQTKKYLDKWKYPLTNVCKCGNNQAAKPCATVKDASGEPILHFLGLPWRKNKEATAMATKFCEHVNAQSKASHMEKMREALEKIASMGDQIDHQLGSSEETVYALRHERCLAHNISECARAALAAPPRNCDVGTVEEQHARIRAFCKRHKVGLRCVGCPVNGVFPKNCALIWAQMPYEKGEVK